MGRPEKSVSGPKMAVVGTTPPCLREARAPTMGPAEPLWKRVPTRGTDGRPLSDFMMLIPRLKNRSKNEALAVVEAVYAVLHRYSHAVVFADLNPKLNLLWVSIRPIPGMILEVATAINAVVPESKLVGQKLHD